MEMTPSVCEFHITSHLLCWASRGWAKSSPPHAHHMGISHSRWRAHRTLNSTQSFNLLNNVNSEQWTCNPYQRSAKRFSHLFDITIWIQMHNNSLSSQLKEWLYIDMLTLMCDYGYAIISDIAIWWKLICVIIIIYVKGGVFMES